jgi:hypothetical protein
MRVTGIAICALLSIAAQAQSGGFHRLSMQGETDSTFGAYAIRLAEPNDAIKPTMWQGPVTISQGRKSCTADISLVSAVYVSSVHPFIIVVSASGSNTFINFIEPSSCNQKWERLKKSSAGVQIEGDRLSLLPACEGNFVIRLMFTGLIAILLRCF